MKLNFVTLFNSNYLSRGLVMYQSLTKHCPNFHLYVIAFDDVCYDFLYKQNYSNLTVISLKEFEDTELLNIKTTRSAAEYCWTCTPSIILYAIKTYNLFQCTYIDADMMFFSNPKVLIDEMKDNSVLITEHRYTKEYDQSANSGKYCVQFVTINNDERGLKVINWWRNACIDWCYDRIEDGKFGDQKYLDNWTTQFEGVCELKHLGGGIAPWNVQQYHFKIVSNNKIIGTEIISGDTFEPVFFHYHGLKLFLNNMVSFTGDYYYLNKNCIKVFYKPYARLLNKAKLNIQLIDSSINCMGATKNAPYKPMGLSTLKQLHYEVRRNKKNKIAGKSFLDRIKYHYYYNYTKC